MQFLFVLMGALSLISFARIRNEYDEGEFWLGQAIKVAVVLVYGLILVQFALVPCTFSVWLLCWGLPNIAFNAYDAWHNYDYDYDVAFRVNLFTAIILTVALFILYAIVPACLTKEAYAFVDAYATIVESDVPETATENIGIVSEKTAHRLANPKIAEFGNSSKYMLGNYTKQAINGEVVWITPVEYANAFQAKGSTPGYIIVDAFDITKDVESVDGNKFYYMPSAIWGKDLKRHVRNTMPTKTLFDAMLQIDDEDSAFWVIPYGCYQHLVFMPKVEGVAIVNPTTGAIDCYAVDEVPEWVDAIIPGELAETYGNYYGKNRNNWWGKNFVHTNEFQLTTWEGDDAWSIVYDENGQMWYATDTTTLNESDKSMVGYMMINARTCEIKYYPNVTGLNGKGISENFIQLYKEKTGWSPVEPTLYNIYGTLTWFSTMVDENGSIQAYCLGDTKGNIIGETTMNAALSAYKRMLTTASIGMQDPTENNTTQTVKGTVKRVIINGSLTKILLDTNQVFVIEEAVSKMAQFTQPGDAVEISYLDTQEDEYYVVEFKNSTLE